MSLLNRRSFLTTTAAGLSALPTARGMTLPSEPAKEDPLGVRADFPHHPEPHVSQHRLDRTDSTGGERRRRRIRRTKI